MSDERTYAAAGVSLATAEGIVERLRAAVESTGARGFGAFAGLHPLDEHRFLAASTDSIGTKPVVARRRGALRACGADMAAHCINDVITCGADPLILLDYVAASRLDLEQVAELVEGAAEVCRAAGVALIGGETAELPGVYHEGELDFAATCVGIVERDRVIDGSAVEGGDYVVGLPSAGVHANGFTLVRSVLEVEDYDGPDLLAPTRLYLDDVRRLRDRAHAFAHVTGGGIEGNLGRVVPAGLRAEIDWDAWERPPVFEWLGRHVDEEEARRVFNLGIGYCAVARGARRRPRDRPDRRRVIGVLVSGEGSNLQALLDAGLPVCAVASSRAGARALERATTADVPATAFELAEFADREQRDATMANWLQEQGVRFVVCAGYMHLLTPRFLERFPERIVNVHPSLLPEFPGARAIDDALAAGVETTGVTVHLVDEGLDTGTVIRQEPVPVQPRETLIQRIRAVEHRLLPEVVRELCVR